MACQAALCCLLLFCVCARSQGLDWQAKAAKMAFNVSQVVTPGSFLWARRKGRFLLACEKAAFQGISHFDETTTSDTNMHLIAGNAFCGVIYLALAIALMAKFKLPSL